MAFKYLNIKNILANLSNKSDISLMGRVKALRNHKQVIFLDLNDGSCLKDLQVVLKPQHLSPDLKNGSSVRVSGHIVPSSHPKQPVEMICNKLQVVGTTDIDAFPFKPRKTYNPEYTRQFYHLRAQTRTHCSALRVRTAMYDSLYKFFRERDYFYVDTTALTVNDCEGGGEVFMVNKATTNNPDSFSTAPSENNNFFNVPVYLTVSRQLHLESLVCGLFRVFTFAPNFRAENTRTRQHLSEFYMLEMEEVTESLEHLLQVTEDLVRTMTRDIMAACPEDVEHVRHRNGKKNVFTLDLDAPFTRMTYSEAVEILQKEESSFKFKIKWGEDLKAEHEQFLVKHAGNQPVFITHYPKSIKPFYMKTSGDVAECFDLLAPYCGELCGGSLREDGEDQLRTKLQDLGLEDNLAWYLDLRKFGSFPHGGFGLGIDRYLMYLLCQHHIREVLSFPRITHRCPM